MTLGLLLPLIFCVLLLAASAFFSGSEAALFSLKTWQLESSAGSGKLRLVGQLLKDPPTLLVAILIGNETVNVTLSFVTSNVEHAIAPGPVGAAVGVVVTTVVLVLFGEALPKAISANAPVPVARTYAPLLVVLIRLLRLPIHVLLGVLQRMPLFKPGTDLHPLEELGHLIRAAEAEGSFRKDEQEILVGLLKAQREPASARMVPRTALRFVRAAEGWPAAREAAAAGAAGGIVVLCGETQDDLLGVLTASDLLDEALSGHPADIVKRARQVPLFPETRPLRQVFDDLYRSGWPAVILADEYGGVAGALTRASLASALLEAGLVRSQGPSGRAFAGTTPYDQFREVFATAPRDPRCKTLAGHVLNLAGRIPSEGEWFSDGACRYRVLRVSPRQVLQVEAEPIGPE
jgi:putative hemolysin